jgi:TRAP-type C4-dicarboxylate transport system permease small subunit
MLGMPTLRPTLDRSVLVKLAEYVSFATAYATVIVGTALILILIVYVLLQIFCRYVLNAPLAWTDEAALFLFVWCTLLFATVCVRDRTHVRFRSLVNALPVSFAPFFDRLTMVLFVLFGAILIYNSSEMIDLVWGDRSPAVHYPLQLLYMVIPVHGALVIVHAVANLFIPSVPVEAPVE